LKTKTEKNLQLKLKTAYFKTKMNWFNWTELNRTVMSL